MRSLWGSAAHCRTPQAHDRLSQPSFPRGLNRRQEVTDTAFETAAWDVPWVGVLGCDTRVLAQEQCQRGGVSRVLLSGCLGRVISHRVMQGATLCHFTSIVCSFKVKSAATECKL